MRSARLLSAGDLPREIQEGPRSKRSVVEDIIDGHQNDRRFVAGVSQGERSDCQRGAASKAPRCEAGLVNEKRHKRIRDEFDELERENAATVSNDPIEERISWNSALTEKSDGWPIVLLQSSVEIPIVPVDAVIEQQQTVSHDCEGDQQSVIDASRHCATSSGRTEGGAAAGTAWIEKYGPNDCRTNGSLNAQI